MTLNRVGLCVRENSAGSHCGPPAVVQHSPDHPIGALAYVAEPRVAGPNVERLSSHDFWGRFQNRHVNIFADCVWLSSLGGWQEDGRRSSLALLSLAMAAAS